MIGYKSISKELDVPLTSAANIIKKFKADGAAATSLDVVEKEPKKTSIQVKADLTIVSSGSIHHCLNEDGLHGRRPRKTPLLTGRHNKARLD